MNEDIEFVAAQFIPCAFCHAHPGHWCVTRSGAQAIALHSTRLDWPRRLWLDGYHKGARDAFAEANNRPEAIPRMLLRAETEVRQAEATMTG